MSTALEAALAAFQEANSAPLRLVELAVSELDGEAMITGRILTDRQRHELEILARDHRARLRVDVIADPDSGLELGWVEPAAPLLEIWRRPDAIGDDQARQTEYLATDRPLRTLGALGGAVLLQGPDLTIGWASSAALHVISADRARTDWKQVRRAVAGKAVAAAASSQTVVEAGRAHLGVPYRWGGTTEKGFDCSGLVQRVTAGATGVLLPKHSADQRRVGARVTATEARAGDLVFATLRARKVGHVMLLTSPDTVLHACQAERSVIEESLARAVERYQLRGYRRPVRLLDA
jgi:cell wall-associated NlpC family hydrolase